MAGGRLRTEYYPLDPEAPSVYLLGKGLIEMARMQAGASQATITPPVGVDLAGYAHREGPSVGLHDDLWCRALVLDDGDARLALIALDLLSADFELDGLLRAAVDAHANRSLTMAK